MCQIDGHRGIEETGDTRTSKMSEYGRCEDATELAMSTEVMIGRWRFRDEMAVGVQLSSVTLLPVLSEMI